MDVRVRRRSLASSEPCLSINSALCCPRSLWKMKSVYHCDWHHIVSPFFLFFFLNTYTHETPPCPPPPTITSIAPLRHTHTHTHTHTQTHSYTYTPQAQTASDREAATASACSMPCAVVCMVVRLPHQYAERATLLLRPPEGETHTSVW